MTFSATPLPQGEITPHRSERCRQVHPARHDRWLRAGGVGHLTPSTGWDLSCHWARPSARSPPCSRITNLFLHLSVFDNIAIGLHPGLRLNPAQKGRCRRPLDRGRPGEMLTRLRNSFSGGQQQGWAGPRPGAGQAAAAAGRAPSRPSIRPCAGRCWRRSPPRLRAGHHRAGMVSHNPEDAPVIIYDQVFFIDAGRIACRASRISW